MSAKSWAVGIRVEVAYVLGSARSGCEPSGRTLPEIGTIDSSRSGCETASSSAVPAPMLWPSTCARSIPRWSSSATTSEARFGYVMSRSMSAVRPWAWNSTAITRCLRASVGMSPANVRSIVMTPPWRRTSGVPSSPWVS